MSNTNAKNALQMLAKKANFTMRWFAFGDAPDQDIQSPTIELTQRDVKPMPLTLAVSVHGSVQYRGAGLSAMTASIGKCWPFSVSEGERA